METLDLNSLKETAQNLRNEKSRSRVFFPKLKMMLIQTNI
ncbi:MAG: hypothetical protein ACI9UK_001315 [Candidatus Krumholzibacteriia bacterium]|jgi:hypothetical protein